MKRSSASRFFFSFSSLVGGHATDHEGQHRNPALDGIVVFFLRVAAVALHRAVPVRHDDHVVVGALDVAADDLPLLGVGGAEHLHADGDVPHLEHGLDDLLALVFQVLIGGADKHLVLDVYRHGASSQQSDRRAAEHVAGHTGCDPRAVRRAPERPPVGHGDLAASWRRNGRRFSISQESILNFCGFKFSLQLQQSKPTIATQRVWCFLCLMRWLSRHVYWPRTSTTEETATITSPAHLTSRREHERPRWLLCVGDSQRSRREILGRPGKGHVRFLLLRAQEELAHTNRALGLDLC